MNSGKRQALLVLALFVALTLYQLHLPRWCYMGDEVRYLYYSASLYYTHTLDMPAAQWAAYLERTGYPFTAIVGRRQSVVYAALLSPFAGRWSLEAARWCNFAVSLVGVLGIYLLLRRSSSKMISYVTTALAAFAFPYVAYHKTIYLETVMLTVSVWAWYLSESVGPSVVRRTAPLVLIFSLPFLHLRAVPAAVVLFGIYLVSIRPRERGRMVSTYAYPMTLAAVALVGFCVFQTRTYGGLMGNAGGVDPFSHFRRGFPDILAIQLFDRRHGLFTYSPVWLLSVAGLAAGCAKRERTSIEAAVLLAVAGVMPWGTGGECMPARYWVAAVPVLAAGWAAYLRNAKSAALLAALPLLGAITAINGWRFMWTSPTFLENRTISLTYEMLYESYSYFHLGAFLPWDDYELPAAHLEVSYAIVRRLACVALLFVLAQAYGAVTRSRTRRTLAGALSLVLLLAVLARCGVAPVEQGCRMSAEGSSLTITFAQPMRPSLVKVGEPSELWTAPAYPDQFLLETSVDGSTFAKESVIRARSLVAIPPGKPLSALRLSEVERTARARWLTAGPPRVYVDDPHLGLLAILGLVSWAMAYPAAAILRLGRVP